MSIEMFEHVPSLLPMEFFSVACSVFYAHISMTVPSFRTMRKEFTLPDTSEFLGEEVFSRVALCWHEEGILVEISVEKDFEEVYFPDFFQGDAVELFFDTRDLKTAGTTRFCHHFVILPQIVGTIQAIEITRFRTEDTHPLCDPQDLTVTTTFHKDAYSMRVLIPAHCLHGYDPKICDRMGFSYRIHRYGGKPQHFTVSSEHFALEQSPRFWASLDLKK